MKMTVDYDKAEMFLEDYGVPEHEAKRTLIDIGKGSTQAATYRYRGHAMIRQASDSQGRAVKDRYEVDGSYPTADMLYEHTMDNLYEGESHGYTGSPTEWFARVKWPWDGQQWYLIVHDALGFSHIVTTGEHDVNRQFRQLQAEFDAWENEDE